MATAAIRKTRESLTEEQLAAHYAGTLVYKALVEADEPLKASEVARAVGRHDVDLKLARVALSTNAHITAVDRRWTLWTRFLDTRATVDSNIHRILATYGQPMRLSHLARELSAVYGRPAEIYEEMLDRLAASGARYARIGANYIVPVEWLLNTETEADDEVLYDNFLDDEDVFPYERAAVETGLNASDPATFAAFLDATGVPVKARALQFLIWKQDKAGFDAVEVYTSLFLQSGAAPLTGEQWVGPAVAKKFATHFIALAEQEVSENVEVEAQEAAQPLTIGDHEREQLVEIIAEGDRTVLASELLEQVFDVTPDYRTYEEDLHTIISTLAADDRVVWVGSERFRPQGTIPAYVFGVPGILDIPVQNYLDLEGNAIDQLLEDDGLDGGLEREILNPLAQDVLDEEPVPPADPNPPSNARAVIKYHHKQIGTMPMCQFAAGFFPAEPEILETEFILPTGQRAQVWVNNRTRLLYGLIDWFMMIPIDSGATFTLERQTPERYLINYNDESEPTMFVSRNRVNELLALQERAETEALPTFEIMREIMEHYRKGIEYITLLTEVNIVRRTSRRMVASLLSEYHCYFQRGGAWVYDPKKLPQGFDKSKRKYLVKK